MSERRLDMPSINSVQHIVAAIRTEMASGMASGVARAPKRNTRGKSTPAQVSRMVELISQRVAALDPADPQRGRKAFRIFLESVLLQEFGEGLMNDPAFYAMVEQVHSRMEQDSALNAAMATAIRTLLNETPVAG